MYFECMASLVVSVIVCTCLWRCQCFWCVCICPCVCLCSLVSFNTFPVSPQSQMGTAGEQKLGRDTLLAQPNSCSREGCQSSTPSSFHPVAFWRSLNASPWKIEPQRWAKIQCASQPSVFFLHSLCHYSSSVSSCHFFASSSSFDGMLINWDFYKDPGSKLKNHLWFHSHLQKLSSCQEGGLNLHFHAIIQSGNHVAVVQCMKSCRHRSRACKQTSKWVKMTQAWSLVPDDLVFQNLRFLCKTVSRAGVLQPEP